MVFCQCELYVYLSNNGCEFQQSNASKCCPVWWGGYKNKTNKQINNNNKRPSPTIVSFKKSGALCFMYIALSKLSNKIFKKNDREMTNFDGKKQNCFYNNQ